MVRSYICNGNKHILLNIVFDMNSGKIISDFDSHIKKSGCKYYREMYIGVTTDAQKRLFDYHQVDKDKDWWVYSKADDENTAKDVENRFLKLGMRGGFDVNRNSSGATYFVYCYKITPKTVE